MDPIQQQVNDEVARLIGRQSIDLLTLQAHNRALVDQTKALEAERAKLKEWADALAEAAPEHAEAALEKITPIR
jgi:hypothetical protein